MDNRRTFLKKAGLLAGGLSLLETLPAAIQKALAINPADGSTYLDAEHIVFLMQENRSFDHAFGTLKGVRGFNDPRAIALPDGNPVWMQTNRAGDTFLPFRLDIRDTKATWMSSLPHSWADQTDARNDGKFNRWLDVKKGDFPDLPMTMGYYTREDIPFYYALADAFTVCDQHFCSSLTGTTPNRLHFWTGTIRGSQDPGAPARVRNGQTDYGAEANWKTFPERLEEAGVSWKVYQNELSLASGLRDEEDAWLTNFTDNPLEWFSQYRVRFSPTHLAYLEASARELEKDTSEKGKEKYREIRDVLAQYNDALYDALPASERGLHEKAFTTNRNDPDYRSLAALTYDDAGTAREVQVPKGDVLHQFRLDVDRGRLPAVSWLIAPEHYSDHPGSAWYGSWYVSEALDILTRNPEVWKKTIFILTYDENDGCFDHVPPFVAPHPQREDTGKVSTGINTRQEYVTLEEDRAQTSTEEAREGPIGLGYRVPLVIASPWTRGGWVNSEVFDHTSSLMFLEDFLARKWQKKVQEDNISLWRRTICGNLTSVFRPYHGEGIVEPDFLDKKETIVNIHKAQFKRLPDNFRSLSRSDIEMIRSNPSLSPYMPRQEPGTKPANALAYELNATGRLDRTSGNFILSLEASRNAFGAKALGSAFNVYAPGEYLQVPRIFGKAGGAAAMSPVKAWSYAVAPGDQVTDSFPLDHFANGKYHLRVYGPNGFFREFQGDGSDPDLLAGCAYTQAPGLRMNGGIAIVFTPLAGSPSVHDITIIDQAYGKNNRSFRIFEDRGTHGTSPFVLDLDTVQGWYDFRVQVKGFPNFSRRFAGRVETGAPSITDPFMGGVA